MVPGNLGFDRILLISYYIPTIMFLQNISNQVFAPNEHM